MPVPPVRMMIQTETHTAELPRLTLTSKATGMVPCNSMEPLIEALTDTLLNGALLKAIQKGAVRTLPPAIQALSPCSLQNRDFQKAQVKSFFVSAVSAFYRAVEGLQTHVHRTLATYLHMQVISGLGT
ncbi:hypothetical protein P7K49_008130 [Saguinus oedipus]|uniref:Uncharacterized protein n=1 Tax=Saguinus oedipus TaxID=9490 RepID=A0ABQ9VWV5_SAGOE|nr:hypothetical protein P7K49_008130 [Saguinus oedipus]